MGSIQKDRTEEGGKERDKKQGGKSSINHTLYYVLQQWAKRNSLNYLFTWIVNTIQKSKHMLLLKQDPQ